MIEITNSGRESLSIELSAESFLLQKLNYMHNNPVVAGLVKHPEDYKYSSAHFYHTGHDMFNLLSHYRG